MSLITELAIAKDLARRAGEIAMEYRAQELTVERKEQNEPVTAADRAASKLIVSGLQQHFHDDVVISEEEPDDLRRLSEPRVWYVDPIDGTNDFINGRDGFAVMIGLVMETKPVLGVVYQPACDRLLYASLGQGAWCSQAEQYDQKLLCSTKSTLTEFRLIASHSHRSQKLDLIKRTLGVQSEFNVGSVGVKLGYLALAQHDVYVNPSPRCKAWDTCAPEIILSEAKGKMTDLYGAPLRYDQKDLQRNRGMIASNGVIHDQIVDTLAPLFSGQSERH